MRLDCPWKQSLGLMPRLPWSFSTLAPIPASLGFPSLCVKGSLFAVLLFAYATQGWAQTGFVSVDCGGSEDFTSSEGILWRKDSLDYIDHSGGVTADIAGNRSLLPRELRTLRYFPPSQSSAKSCFAIDIQSQKGLRLIRVGFLYGNYDMLDAPPSFLVSLDNDYWAFVRLNSGSDPLYYEAITVLDASFLYLCLMRVQGSGAPLVNSIEVRLLPPDIYRAYAAGDVAYAEGAPIDDRYYISVLRVNFGGPYLRYPLDPYDRIWQDYRTVFPELGSLAVLSSNRSVHAYYTLDEPPDAVIQTAVTGPHFSFSFNVIPRLLSGSEVYTDVPRVEIYPSAFFAELGNLSKGQVRNFTIGCSDVWSPYNLILPPDNSTVELTSNYSVYVNNSVVQTTCTVQALQSDLGGVLNALDFYTVQFKVSTATSGVDVQALDEIRSKYQIQHLWFGDPCLPVPWDAVGCTPITVSPMRVTSLNLAGMNLSGPIAPSIASLSALRSLNLSNNRINGPFPSWLGSQLPNLESLDLSNNQISGTYPESLAAELGANFRISGNDGLCSSNGRGCKARSVDYRKVVIASVVSGSCVVALILTPILYCTFLSHSSKNGLFDKQYRHLQARLKTTGARARPLSYFQIRKVTKGFKTKIGEGGFGPVYYGKLKNGQEVAVKVLSAKSRQGKQEFYNEIELLSIVHHKHLVSLLGYCQSWTRQVLVYEYMKGGDLGQRLHGKAAASNPLTWTERTNILLEVAEGLLYLHDGCKPAIIHRDIKSNNILLTERATSKVADFGLSKLLAVDEEDATHVTTAVKGTTGYLDPEYYITNKLTEKSDVYGYGVLLMETITGRNIVDYNVPSEHLFIVDWVRQAWRSQELDQLADENLAGQYDKETFSGLVNLSLWCVERTSVQRPPMTEILKELRRMGLSSTTSYSTDHVVSEAANTGDFQGHDHGPLVSTTSSSTTRRSSNALSSDTTT